MYFFQHSLQLSQSKTHFTCFKSLKNAIINGVSMASRWAGGPPRIHKDSLAETNPSQDWENSKTSRTNLPLDPIKSQAINFCSACRDGGFFLPPLSHQAANFLIIFILPLALWSQPSGPCNRNVPK